MSKKRVIGPFILLVLAIVFSVTFVPNFATRTNVGYLLLQAVPLLLTATGQVLVILTAGIDLSVGQTVTMATVIASVLMQAKNGGVLVAVLVCIVAAVAIGAANAIMVVRFRLPPFLATLGMTFFLAGMALYIRAVPGGFIPQSFQSIADTDWSFVPAAALVVLVLLAVLAVYVDRSRFGVRARAVGADESGARLAGVPAGRTKFAAYVAAALLAMLGGLFIAARTGTGDPLVGGSYQLASITAAVLGGASLAGGEGTVWGAMMGALVLAMLSNVLNLLAIVQYWQWVLQGSILIIAVAMYEIRFGRAHAGRRFAGFRPVLAALTAGQVQT